MQMFYIYGSTTVWDMKLSTQIQNKNTVKIKMKC